MRRRTKRARYTWMPMLGQPYNNGEGGVYNVTARNIIIFPSANIATPPTQSASGLFLTPLVPDYTEEEDAASTTMTLRDYTEGQDWFLRRLVGKISLGCITRDITGDDTQFWPTVIVGAGFFVARAKDDNQTQVDAPDAEVDPLNTHNIRQPWLWRRTWMLGASQVQAESGNPGAPQFSAIWPNTTEAFGSMSDGPHVDAKTMRRILREQRLWFAVSCIGFRDGSATQVSQADQPLVMGTFDIRALGQMRRSKNRSAF